MSLFHVFFKNVTDKPDIRKVSFLDIKTVIFIKNSDFHQKPLGLDRGFGHSDQPCPLVVSRGVQLWCLLWFLSKSAKSLWVWIGFWQKCLKKCKNHCFPCFLVKCQEITKPLGLDRGFGLNSSIKTRKMTFLTTFSTIFMKIIDFDHFFDHFL